MSNDRDEGRDPVREVRDRWVEQMSQVPTDLFRDVAPPPSGPRPVPDASLAEPPKLDLTGYARLLRGGDIGPVQLVTDVLDRIERVEPQVNAFAVLDAERALRHAHELEREFRSGHVRGPLHGIPVAVKDIFDVAGLPTGCGSDIFADAPAAAADSAVVARLRTAGAVIVGKTRTHELALGVSTPPARNPWDLRRSPGGSSGGSGAAVAAGIAFAAIGSDTGGSIRTPSALCGVVGLKPTYGRVSRSGALSLSWSLDHAGALTRTVSDAALLLAVLAGPDTKDVATLGQPPFVPPNLNDASLHGRRLGIIKQAFLDGMDDATAIGFQNATEVARGLGATIVELSVPELAWALRTELTILLAEAASYHAERLESRPELIGDDVRVQLQGGALLPASAYLTAQRVRSAIQRAMAAAFGEHRLDAVLAPTVPSTAHLADQEMLDLQGYLEAAGEAYVRTTGPANLCGLPAIALPCELSSAGLPVSVQFVGEPFQEARLLQLAAALQAGTAWGPEWRPAPLVGRI